MYLVWYKKISLGGKAFRKSSSQTGLSERQGQVSGIMLSAARNLRSPITLCYAPIPPTQRVSCISSLIPSGQSLRSSAKVKFMVNRISQTGGNMKY